MTYSVRLVGLTLAALSAALPSVARAQDAGGVPAATDSANVAGQGDADPNALLLAKKRRAAALAGQGSETPAATVPVAEEAPDPNELPDPLLQPDPVAPDPVLRSTTTDITRLRSVVRPVDNVKPALPVTGPAAPPVDPEAEARNAYNPAGLRFGSFVVNTTVVGAVGYSDQSKSSASEGFYLRTQGDVALKSDWEVNALDISLGGGLRRSLEGGTTLDETASAKIDGRLDLTDVDKLTGSLGWSLKKDDSSASETGSTSAKGHVDILSGSLGFERHAGLIGVALNGAVDRSTYDLGSDRNNTAYSASLRLSLDSGATLTPFVEGGAFTRIYDKEKDASGYARSSVGGDLKAGIEIETGLITGEASVGYAYEAADDSRLGAVAGFTADTSLAWAVTPLATVTLKGNTTFEPTQVAKASGSIKRTVDADLAYAIQPNIILNAGGGLSYQDYYGIDRSVTTATIRGGAGWKLNQMTELGVTATHSITDSTVKGEDSDESTIEFTVTLRQ